MPAVCVNALRFWLIAAAVVGVLLWLFNAVLLPFLVGIAIAYFLEPPVSALEKRGISRGIGSFGVLTMFFLLVGSIFLLIWPMLSEQITTLINSIPDYAEQLRSHYLPSVQKWLSRFTAQDVAELRTTATQSTGEAVSFVGATVKGILSRSVAIIDAIGLSILTPITAFYVLRDWKKMTKVIDDMIPRAHYKVITKQLDEIDQTLSGFMRGQALVALFLGAFYAVGLALNGLQYGATIGIIAGVLSMIPYVGSFFGVITSTILASVQFSGDLVHIGLVLLVFIIGNAIETYYLTPKLVGSRVGLHPVWILFALIAAIKLIGFTGALIAVPAAAVIGVLARFGAEQYKSSSFYK
jgi:predicted PurR-regulated permease PerM